MTSKRKKNKTKNKQKHSPPAAAGYLNPQALRPVRTAAATTPPTGVVSVQKTAASTPAATTQRSSLAKRRANHAMQVANRLAASRQGQSALPAEDYARAAKQLPLRIMQTGLGQAAVYLMAKRKFGPLLIDLAGWVIPQCQNRPLAGGSVNEKSLVEWVMQADAQTVRHATQEAVEWLLWLNRFCESQGIRGGGNDRDRLTSPRVPV